MTIYECTDAEIRSNCMSENNKRIDERLFIFVIFWQNELLEFNDLHVVVVIAEPADKAKRRKIMPRHRNVAIKIAKKKWK